MIDNLNFIIDERISNTDGWYKNIKKSITLKEIEDMFNTNTGDMSLVSQLCRELRSMYTYCSFLTSCARCGDEPDIEYEEFKKFLKSL